MEERRRDLLSFPPHLSSMTTWWLMREGTPLSPSPSLHSLASVYCFCSRLSMRNLQLYFFLPSILSLSLSLNLSLSKSLRKNGKRRKRRREREKEEWEEKRGMHASRTSGIPPREQINGWNIQRLRNTLFLRFSLMATLWAFFSSSSSSLSLFFPFKKPLPFFSWVQTLRQCNYTFIALYDDDYDDATDGRSSSRWWWRFEKFVTKRRETNDESFFLLEQKCRKMKEKETVEEK